MYVCVCHGITDRQIKQAAADGVRTMNELTAKTGCSGTCGSCTDMAREVLADAHASKHVCASKSMAPLFDGGFGIPCAVMP